jgi:hypothetical protein
VITLVAEDVPVTADAPPSTETIIQAGPTEPNETPMSPSTTLSNKPVYVSGLEAVLCVFPIDTLSSFTYPKLTRRVKAKNHLRANDGLLLL